MEMLAQSAALFPAGVEEVEIQTIYSEDSDAVSHFHPLRDGMRIYAVLFRRFPRFLISSLLAFLVDYLAFNLLYYLVFTGFMVSSMPGFHWTQMFTMYYEWYGALAAIPMLLYNGKRGGGHKAFFYLFYPAHIYILYALSWGIYFLMN